MNIYNDGQHYVGKLCRSRIGNRVGARGMRDEHKKRMRTAFRTAYNEANEQKLKEAARKEYIQDRFPELLEADGYDAGIDTFAMYSDEEYDAYMKDTVHMLYMRKKRFRRKANLNEWNYFVTVTYDDDKMTAEQFVPAIRKTLSNFHSRYGWNYCAVFEAGAEGGRIHLHALMYIPDDQIHGKFFLRPQWSEKRHRYEFCNDHDYFHGRFGNCDFKRIDRADMRGTVNYLTKYMTKTDTKLIYSRGVPDEFRNVDVDVDDIFRIVPHSCGYVAILCDSATGIFVPDEDELQGYLDYGDMDDFRFHLFSRMTTA